MRSAAHKVVYAALAGNLLIAVTKFIAAAITGSSAMLSEGVHSLVDTGNQALLLYGMRRARQPADERFPFGHGKEIYFWSFVVALLVFAAGAAVSLYEGVHRLLNPAPLENAYINYIVLALAAVFEGSSWTVAFREFRAQLRSRGVFEAVRVAKDPTDFAVLLEDSAALAGIAVASLGVLAGDLTGEPRYDGIASIMIGCILAGTAWWLARETKSLLIGESASREVVGGIRRLAESHPDVRGVHEILTMHVGPDFILANVSVEIPPEVPRERAHAVLEELDRDIKRSDPRVKRVFIESQPGHPEG
ncbi:MAG: cation transporter [Betaproteobacteria bacterium]|nr:MAG: cation transporter [Betaproteobacteria bacterium]